jgi:hypothetical protein
MMNVRAAGYLPGNAPSSAPTWITIETTETISGRIAVRQSSFSTERTKLGGIQAA